MSLGQRLRKAREDRGLTASQVAVATKMKVQTVEALEAEDFTTIAAPIYGKGFIRLYATHVGLDAGPLIDEYMSRLSESKSPSLRAGSVPRGRRRGPEVEPPREETANTETDLFESTEAETARPEAESRVRRPRVDLSAASGKIVQAATATAARVGASIGASTGAAGRAVGGACRRCVESMGSRFQNAVRFLRGWRLDLSGLRLAESPVRLVSVIAGVLIVLVFIVSGLSRCVRKPADDEPVVATDEIEELLLATEPPEPYVD